MLVIKGKSVHKHKLNRVFIPSRAHTLSKDSSPRYILMYKCECGYKYAYDVVKQPPVAKEK